MIKSMTGYGSAKGACGSLVFSLELRSVNNRYLDCGVKLPRGYLFADETIRKTVQKHLSRGKADVFVSVDRAVSDDMQVRLNEPLARSYGEALRRLCQVLGTDAEVSPSLVARFPDVLSVEQKEADRDQICAGLEKLCEEALADFDLMRTAEGRRMAEDISARLDSIEALVTRVEARSPETVAQYRERLEKKLRETLENTAIDESRLLTEAAIFADKVAVDEETVRLRSHIAQMRGMLAGDSPIGRKMDFLVQEFNREANTIGSKCTDGELAAVVIEIKSEIEKIREQIQNIE